MSDDTKKAQTDEGTAILTPRTTGAQPAAPPSAATVVRAQPDAATMHLTPPAAAAAAPEATMQLAAPTAAPGAAPAPAPATPAPFQRTLPGRHEVDRVIGQVLAGYEVIRQLAEGGMGVVYEGRHAKLGRRGAIKLLKPEYCQSDDIVERFYQEARAVNEIHHENIVDIYDFGRSPDGRVFFVMEFLEGESLGARLSRGPLPFAEALPVLEQVIRALKAAHDKGFAHRDLKPDNIWLKRRDDGGTEVRLLDFGIAKLVGLESAREKLTRTGSIIGTPTYMSPEQINGEQTLDARTDIYSLGIILYELFTGRTPFGGDSLAAIMTGHLFNEPPPLVDLPPALGVPAAVQQIVERMLAKDPAQRYQSVSDVLTDLRAVAQHREPSEVSRLNRERPRTVATGLPHAGGAQAAPAPVPVAVPARRKLLVPVAAVAAIGLGVGGYLALRPGATPATAPPPVAITPTPTPSPTPGPTPTPTPPVAAIDFQQVGRDARGVLRDALGHSEPRVRVHGSDGVGAIKDRPSEPTLLELATADPDAEVRGHAASALGALGASAAREPLAKAERAAVPPLKVWYASALARLGERDARKRLIKYAKDKDLAVAFRATLALADASAAGDKDAIAALVRLAARETELNDVAPYAGAVLLGKLASLRYERARPVLYQILEDKNERTRLAAAEGLARLGDEAALAPLKATLDDAASSNRLVAAVALIPLGDYAGFDLLNTKLADPDPDTRRLAARGLGEIGEKGSVAALVPLLQDADWTVRVASAVALVFVVGLDPMVLAQASVDWAKGALESEDWAVRSAGAGVLGDMAEDAAVPLLAQAILDPEPRVRRAAARSSRKMKGKEAARVVADAALAERDPEVKAEQVRALGAIADVLTLPALQEMSQDRGIIGVLASGARIAVGDVDGNARLTGAIVDPRLDVRVAAVEASVLAKNPIAVPTLATGTKDRVLDVRFAAAEGLAQYQAEAAVATPVLEEGLTQRDVSMQSRARAALLAFGQVPRGGTTVEQLLESPDPAVRQTAALEIAHLSWAKARPLVRRMLADPEAGVRARGLDVVETGAPDQRAEAIKLYKTVVDDGDPGVRAKAQARLSRIAEPLVATPAAATPPTPPPVAPPPAVTPDAAVPAVAPDVVPDPAVDTKVVDAAAAAATKARDEATAAAAAIDQIARDLEAAIVTPADDDRDIRKVKEFARAARPIRDRLAALAAQATAAATEAEAAAKATPSSAAAAGATAARAAAVEAARLATAAATTSADLDKKADDYASAETSDVDLLLSAADAAIASGKYADAKRDLDKAAAQAADAGESYPAIKFSYGRMYDGLAKRAKQRDDRLPLLVKAKASYDAFAARGSGPKVARARERSAELAEEIAELEAETP